jgi:hypothetical protein
VKEVYGVKVEKSDKLIKIARSLRMNRMSIGNNIQE